MDSVKADERHYRSMVDASIKVTPHQPVCSKFEAPITGILSTWNMFKTFLTEIFEKLANLWGEGSHISVLGISTSCDVRIAHESQNFFFCCNPKWLQTHPPKPKMDSVKEKQTKAIIDGRRSERATL